MSKTERSKVLTGRNKDRGKGKFSRGMESKPEILNVPGPLLFSHTDTFFSHFRDCSNHKSDIRRNLCNFRDCVNLRGAAEPRIINFRRGVAELCICNFNSTRSMLNLRNSKSSNFMKM